MNPDAIVSRGNPPWCPTKEATDVDALHAWDAPLIGTFELRGETVLFACLTGAMSTLNVWGYVPLTNEQVEELDGLDFESTEDLEDWAHGQFVGRKVCLALADEDRIVRWTPDEVDDEGVLASCIRFMDLAFSDTKHQSSRRSVTQARADATRRELELNPS